MPPKAKIGKERILQGAMALVRKKGSGALTAKSLAATLSCSTQPIFWHYGNMEALKKDVFREALAVFGEYLRRETPAVSPYMSVGLNYIRFASEEKELFCMLFMSDFGQTDLFGARVEMEYILGVIEESGDIRGEDAQTVYRDMWLFSHGIAAMTATGTANFSDEEVRTMLGDVYRGLVKNLESKKNKNKEE